MALPSDQLRGPSAYGHSDEDVTLALRAIHDAAVHLYARGTTPEPAAITAHLAQLVHERDRLRAEVGG